MKRDYTASFYLSRIELIRRFIPEATFGADVIVGFPGESASAFARTCAMVEAVGFVNLHIFRYSRRAGTRAEDFPNVIPAKEMRARVERITELARTTRQMRFDAFLGQEEDVLVEEKRDGRWRGYTRGYVDTVFVSEEGISVGDEIRIRIVRANDAYLEGVKDDKSSMF